MPDAPAPATPEPRGPNNRRLAETLGRHHARLTALAADPEAAALAASRGYSAARLADGLALADAALAAYAARDAGTGARTAAAATLRQHEAATHRLADDLRSTLRALYDGQTAHLETLGVARPRPADDRDAFLTETRATLASARRAPYAAALADTGVPTADLDALGAALDGLTAAAATHGSARGQSATSTASRDEAYDALQAWMTRLRRLLRPAFRDAPAVAARLGL